MKKLFALSITVAMLASAVSCGKKSDSSTAEQAVPDPIVTQTMYKEERIKLSEELGSITSMHINENGSIKVLFRDWYNNLRAADITSDYNLSGSYAVKVPENTEISFIDFNPDGTASAFLMYCEDFEGLYTGSNMNPEYSFSVAEFDSDLNIVSQTEVSGMDNYFSYGETFFQSFTKCEGGYVLCTSRHALKIDSSGKVTAHADVDFNNYYVSCSDGRIVNFNNLAGYGFADSDTLEPPSSPTAFEMSAPIQRPPYVGDDEYLAYIILKDGYYGLTQNCKLQKIIDFTASLIDAGSVYCISKIEKGRYLASINEEGTSYLAELIVRPDDYVNERKTVIVGMHNIVNQSDYELANEFAKVNDDYIVEYRQYDWDSDDLRDDILTGNAPDMFIGREDDVYRYTNLGAFMGLDELHEKYGGLSRDDLLPNIAESYTYKGDIYGIPNDFFLSRIFLADKDVISRDDAFWNFDQFMDIYNSMPEDMYLSTQYSWVQDPESIFSAMYMYEDFIDFDNATCDFDCDDFIRRIEFCKNARVLPPLGDDFYQNATPEEQRMSMEENTYMLKNREAMFANIWMHNLSSIVSDVAHYHYSIDEVTILPAPNDNGCATINVNNGFYSIVRNGNCPEGAWAYLNYIMDDDRITSQMFTPHLPVTKVAYEYWMNKWREDCNQLNESSSDYNGYKITYSTVISDESFEYINELLTTAKTSLSGMSEELRQIIFDEVRVYFNDECSAEECADMLQNRVTIFLSERS